MVTERFGVSSHHMPVICPSLPPRSRLLAFFLFFSFARLNNTIRAESARHPSLLCKIMPRALSFISFALFVLCALVGCVERKMFSYLHMIIGERSRKYHLLILSSGRLTKTGASARFPLSLEILIAAAYFPSHKVRDGSLTEPGRRTCTSTRNFLEGRVQRLAKNY